MVRQVPTRSSPDGSGDKVGTHHERRYENPFALSDSLIGISSSRLLSHMKVVGIPKAFGRLFRLVVPIHREERDDSSESLSKGDLAKQGTFGAKPLIKEGADYIKITATGGGTRTSFPLRPSFDVDELRAITDEAHKFGKLATAHCMATQGIVNALDAGVDMIIHCYFKNSDGTDKFRPDVAERMGKQEVYINPTVHVARGRAWTLQRKNERQGLTTREQARLDQDLRTFDDRLQLCRRLIDMGLKVITGSDSSWDDYRLGNTVYEAECLVMAGYSPMKAIVSVTGEATRSPGIDDTLGTLEPSKEADVIIVDGNPAEHINALRNVSEVFFAGQRVERGSAKSLDAIRQWRPGAS